MVVREIGGPYGLLTGLSWLLGAIAVVTFPARRAQRWGFKIGEGQLRVARGWLFRTDTIVPFVRVQHIDVGQGPVERWRTEEHTSELQSLMRISYAVFCLKKKKEKISQPERDNTQQTRKRDTEL